jgi:EAL domain-containing protein (putative c-di-GMP-specific phosphodiesterase class I)
VLKRLEQVGVDFAQGYGVGRPAPLDKLESVRLMNGSSIDGIKRARRPARRSA